MRIYYITYITNLKTLLLVLFLIFGLGLSAQIITSYSIGGVAGNMKMNTYSNPFIITGAECINVSNTISKFLGSNKGEFFNKCVVDIDYVKINIKIYPNPVVNYVSIKFLSKLQSTDKFRVTIFNNIGQPVLSKDVSQEYLLIGYKIDVSSIASGYYYIQVASSSILQTFKFLKN